MNRAEKFWDRMAARFDGKNEKFAPALERAVACAKRRLRPGDLVLDYGCATGAVALEIAAAVGRVRGIDISSRMVAAAQAKATARAVANVDFAQATLFDREVCAEPFDAVLAFNILHLLEEPREAVRRLAGLLKPGGVLLSATPCLAESGPLLRLPISLLARAGIFPAVRFFSSSDLEEMMSGEGFRILEIEFLNRRPRELFIAARR